MNAASPVLNLAPAAPSPSGAMPIALPDDGHTALPGDFSGLLDVGEGVDRPVETDSPVATDNTLATDIGQLDDEPPAEGEEQPHEQATAEPIQAMLSTAMTTVQWTVGLERVLQLAKKPAADTSREPALFAQGAAPVAVLRGNHALIPSEATTPTVTYPAVADAAAPPVAAIPAAATPVAAKSQGVATGDAAAGARASRLELQPILALPAGAEPANASTNVTRNGFVLEGESVRLPTGDTSLWQRPLAQALGDRLQVQASQGIEQARIRLEPPALGRIEIVLRQEGNQLQVQLSASNTDVVRQLQAMGEGMRQELSQKQGTQVSVQVFEDRALADGRNPQRERQQQPQEANPGQGLMSESKADHRAFTLT